MPNRPSGLLLLALVLAGCGAGAPTTAPGTLAGPTPAGSTPTAAPSAAAPAARTILVDTDVAGDDLVALTFLLTAPQVEVAGITVSGTGEAHCEGGVEVVLRLLERLAAPAIPVACGRETPLQGTHEFPFDWRMRADAGSGLDLPATDRTPSDLTAVELIAQLATDHPGLTVLTLGPLTNLADALLAEPSLADGLGQVFVMGGALHVPGNLVCCGAPEGNHVAEWNLYVDPHAANVVIESGLRPSLVSLDGTSQVPVTPEFAGRVREPADAAGRRVLADLFAANPFMAEDGYYLWDPLAAEAAAGYRIGTFTPARIVVEEAEGPEVGFTRPVDGEPNVDFLSTADRVAAEETLLRVLAGG